MTSSLDLEGESHSLFPQVNYVVALIKTKASLRKDIEPLSPKFKFYSIMSIIIYLVYY